MSWNAKNEKGEFIDCFIILNVSSGQFDIGKATINGKGSEPKEILELAKQNEAMLIKGKALHEILTKSLKQASCEEESVQPQKEEVVITLEAVPIPSSRLVDSLPKKQGELEAGCIGGTYDHYLPKTRLDKPSAEKSDPEYRAWDR